MTTANRPRLDRSDADWRANLTSEQYRVLREKGTERAFSGDLWDEHRAGIYRCAGCDAELFDSGTKFDSGTGWPSFSAPTDDLVVDTKVDRALWMSRTEALCASCGGHLGHVFSDGPAPTGLRYCINSASLRLAGARRDVNDRQGAAAMSDLPTDSPTAPDDPAREDAPPAPTPMEPESSAADLTGVDPQPSITADDSSNAAFHDRVREDPVH